MVKEFHATGLGNTMDGDIDEWPKTIDKLLNKFTMAEIVIPGHGKFGGLELIRHTRELFDEMMNKQHATHGALQHPDKLLCDCCNYIEFHL